MHNIFKTTLLVNKMDAKKLLIFLFLTILVSTFIVAARGEHEPKLGEGEKKGFFLKLFDFAGYIDKFRKAYDPVQTLARSKLFLARTMKIFQHNALFCQQKISYFLSQNEFTDKTSQEVRENFIANMDLEPVDEAKIFPNQPADSVESVQMINGEAMSMASSGDLKYSAKYDPVTQKIKPIVSFMDYDEGVLDFRSTMRELRQLQPDIDKLSEVVDIEGSKKYANENTKAQHIQGNKYQHVVSSNNENYDPSLMPSQGVMKQDKYNLFGNNYAKFLMDDLDLDMSPYPEPVVPTGKVLPEMERTSSISSLLGTVKSLYDFFTTDDDEMVDEMEIDDIDEMNIEPTSLKPNLDDEVAKRAQTGNQQISYKVDWRASGCLTKPRSQLSCNSCYAFSTLALMEYYYCKQTDKLTDFSAQYVVDCGVKTELNGCASGKVSNVGKFISLYGIELNSLYPYNGKENNCPFSDEEDKAKKTGYLRPRIKNWQRFNDMGAWYKWIGKSPIIVGVNMPLDFFAYGGGIHDGLDCTMDMPHALLLVGFGFQDGREFWLMKNSFSDSWGEEGYFRLARNAPLKCFNSAVVARVDFMGENGNAKPVKKD